MKLENAFKQGDRGNFISILADFDNSLHQVLTSIGELKENDELQIESFTESSLAIATLSPIFTRLQQLLQKNDLVEDELLELLQKHVSGSKYENEIKIFEEYIDNYDYQKALSVLSDMSEYMGIPFHSLE